MRMRRIIAFVLAVVMLMSTQLLHLQHRLLRHQSVVITALLQARTVRR